MTPKRKTPIWAAIATTLRIAIQDGQYQPADKLPTEAELAARFGVNRHTVRRALAALASEGLVHSRRGAGVFVLGRPLDYPLSDRVRFHENLISAGRLPEKSMLSIETRAASAREAEHLGVPPGATICVTTSISSSDGVPVALAESLFPECSLPGVADAFRRESSVTQALALVGVEDYKRTSTRLSAEVASATQALHLQLREGAPLLSTRALNVDSRGRVVEYGRAWFASERITLTLDH